MDNLSYVLKMHNRGVKHIAIRGNKMSTKKIHTLRQLTGKQLSIAGGIVLLLLAVIIGIAIYNTPANRLSRQLDWGQRHLEE